MPGNIVFSNTKFQFYILYSNKILNIKRFRVKINYVLDFSLFFDIAFCINKYLRFAQILIFLAPIIYKWRDFALLTFLATRGIM